MAPKSAEDKGCERSTPPISAPSALPLGWIPIMPPPDVSEQVDAVSTRPGGPAFAGNDAGAVSAVPYAAEAAPAFV
jgi:hypothetical protein